MVALQPRRLFGWLQAHPETAWAWRAVGKLWSSAALGLGGPLGDSIDPQLRLPRQIVSGRALSRVSHARWSGFHVRAGIRDGMHGEREGNPRGHQSYSRSNLCR